jgi:hypothetical protein
MGAETAHMGASDPSHSNSKSSCKQGAVHICEERSDEAFQRGASACSQFADLAQKSEPDSRGASPVMTKKKETYQRKDG